jgi:RHS repeat-associated protein
VLDAEWNVRSGGSAYDWFYLHQGGRYDVTSGLYHFRFRDYSPTLGRWTSLDPLSYAAGDVNLYRSVGNNPLNSLDPSGLDDDIPLPHAVAVPLPNPRLPLLSPPSPPPSWFDRLFDEFQMIGTFVVNSPGEATWEYYTGLAYGAYGVFIEPVVNTGEAILDVGGFILIDDYEPLNPHLRGMLNGERTWYGGTVSLVVDGLVVVPVVRGGQQVIRLGGSAAYKWLSVRAYRTIESEVSALQVSAASIRAQWIQHEQEAEALWRLIELTGQVPKSHFLGRHSPSVSMDALRERAIYGIEPWVNPWKGKVVMVGKDGELLLVDSTRFTSYRDMLEAIEKAQRVFKAQHAASGGVAPKNYDIILWMKPGIGEGCAKITGVEKSGLTHVRVVLDKYGRPITAHPLYAMKKKK